MSFPGRLYGLVPLALVLGVSLYASGFWLLLPVDQPVASDYQEVERLIRAGFAPGDAVAVRPWWAARIREYVGDLPFVQVRDLADEDLSRFARLWVVVLPDGDDQLPGPFADGRYLLEQEHVAGKLLLRLYRLPAPAQVLYDFRTQLRRARVRMFSGNSWKDCGSWVEDRWVCSTHDWNYIGRMIVELGDDPREILWAHPSDTGPIEVSYPDVPGGRTLLVHTGFTPPAARTPEGAPVNLEVLVDGRQLGKVVQQNQSGHFPTAFDITGLGPGPHTVTFQVSSPNVGMRHFCFDGEVRQ